MPAPGRSDLSGAAWDQFGWQHDPFRWAGTTQREQATVLQGLAKLAAARGQSFAQFALAWVLRLPGRMLLCPHLTRLSSVVEVSSWLVRLINRSQCWPDRREWQ